MGELSIRRERPDRTLTILRLKGEFEGMAVINAKEELLGHLQETLGTDFVIDFGEVPYIDSAGIGILLEMAKMASEKNIKLGLVNVREPVKNVLVVTKVDKVLKIYG